MRAGRLARHNGMSTEECSIASLPGRHKGWASAPRPIANKKQYHGAFPGYHGIASNKTRLACRGYSKVIVL
jgi:hypothetical protein